TIHSAARSRPRSRIARSGLLEEEQPGARSPHSHYWRTNDQGRRLVVAPDIRRGEIWWATLPAPKGAGPGYRRPVLVIQSDVFNQSRIETVIVASITSNLERSQAIGNVLVRAEDSQLSRDSVVNVSQLVTYDRQILREHVSSLPDELM